MKFVLYWESKEKKRKKNTRYQFMLKERNLVVYMEIVLYGGCKVLMARSTQCRYGLSFAPHLSAIVT